MQCMQNEKIKIRMFPDYCSSGLWEWEVRGHNLEPDELGVSKGLQIALKYWHWYWEMVPSDKKMPEPYLTHWKKEAEELAALMTTENEKYEFHFIDYD